jgi:arylsulfatase A-like enzyme
MNAIVICSETLCYDQLGFLGGQPVAPPHLDSLARESARFSDFQVCSFPAMVSRIYVFTGRQYDQAAA